jgi:NDP-sugar pyrophosphorylase family protein
MNGDLLTDLDFLKMIEFHRSQNADFTVALKTYQQKVAYGIVELDSDSHIIQLKEKPELTFLINSGIYVLSPNVLSLIPDEGIFLMTELMGQMMAKGMNVLGYEFTESWHDIGRLDDYMKIITKNDNENNLDKLL